MLKRFTRYVTQSVAGMIGIFIPDKALALLGADAGLIGLGETT